MDENPDSWKIYKYNNNAQLIHWNKNSVIYNLWL